MNARHFLSLDALTRDVLQEILERGIALKYQHRHTVPPATLQGRILAMIFTAPSTRTRVSFAAAMAKAGGQTIELDMTKMQLQRGEPIADTAHVLSRMVDAIMIRTPEHEMIETLADAASIPVINGLSNTGHPCQLLADLMTWFEHRGELQGQIAVWLGDGNNVCQSWVDAARIMNFELRLACPEGYLPNKDISHVQCYEDPLQAAHGANVLITDVWASMGQEQEKTKRVKALARYQVNAEVVQSARDDVLFMHCLPAHRGEEVTAEVIDGPHSVVWEEAGNRLHAQQALLEHLLCSSSP